MLMLVMLLTPLCLAREPVRAQSGLVSDLGGGFLIRDTAVRYGKSYRISGELDRPLFVVAEFENPPDIHHKLMTELTYDNEGILSVQSPSFTSAQLNKSYRLKLKIYSDADHTRLVAVHHSTLTFRLNPALANKLGIDLL